MLKTKNKLYISGTYYGIEKIVILGDIFVRQTAKSQFLRLKDAYSKRFDIDIAAGDIFSDVNQVTCRITNAYVQKLNNCINMPKIVLVVLENDIINEVELKSFGVSEYYGRHIEEIINECNKITLEFANILPFQAKRDGWPKFIWVSPTQHNYTPLQKVMRGKFTEVLENIAQHHRNVWPVKLRQIWDENNNSLFSHANNKFTNEGLHTFWTAIDRTLKYCDKKITRQEAGLDTTYTSNSQFPSVQGGVIPKDNTKSGPPGPQTSSTTRFDRNNFHDNTRMQPSGYYDRTFGRCHNVPKRQLSFN